MPKGIPNVQARKEKPVNLDPNYLEYPKMLYFKGDATNQKVVNSADEEKALGDDWEDAPAKQVPTE